MNIENVLNMSLSIITKMGFNGYFLIVSDFIKWAKRNNIPVGPGRGSGAGSLVAWAMEITNIDPLRFGLIFERFLNPERISMPDFDIDFCQDRREEVIDYVSEKYGRENVAQIITFGQMHSKMAIRDVGRVLGMPYYAVDRICSIIPYNPAKPIHLRDALDLEPKLKELYDSDENIHNLIDNSIELDGLYRHSSIHAAGIVIGDRPLKEIIPICFEPKHEIAITQYNMKDVESVGLVKFDFLGLKTLSVIQQTLNILKSKGIDLDIEKIELDDAASFKMIVDKLTVGIFQLEGHGVTDIASKMQIATFEEIIALISLYRPGPLDNIPSYIERKMGREPIVMLDESLREILEITYGIPVYQEQIIKIAQVFAGYSAGKADLLRRAMGKKIAEVMSKEKENFVKGAVKNGHDTKIAEEIFATVDKFSGYGFNKSHAAAYALISYQTAYLKTHYPAPFMSVHMNYLRDNTDKLAISMFELKKMNIKLLPPDVNKSYVLFQPESDELNNKENVRYGLSALKNISCQFVEDIIIARNKGGVFTSVNDFFQRVSSKGCNSRQLEHLVKSGAFDSLNPNRKQIFNKLDELRKIMSVEQEMKKNNLLTLMKIDSNIKQEVEFEIAITDWSSLKRLEHELEAIGFYISYHPLEKFSFLKSQGKQLLSDLDNSNNEINVVSVLLSKQIKISKKSQKRYAFLRLSDTTGVKEVSIFSTALNKFENFLEEESMLDVTLKPLIRKDDSNTDSDVTWIVEKIESMDKIIDSNVKESKIILLFKKNITHTITEDIKLLKEKLKPGNIVLEIHHKTKGEDIIIDLGQYSFQSLDSIIDDLHTLKKQDNFNN